jgi:glycosyltransferase involved in cell wall biosynthesis
MRFAGHIEIQRALVLTNFESRNVIVLKPKVTIGICGRNCGDLVGFAIQSVAHQDFPHELMEIVFVDDGSDDNTVEVAKNYLSKTDISWRIFSDKWQGLGRARNVVIRNASDDYLVWVDSDEILTKDFVRKQIDAMERNPRVGIVTARLGIPENENLVLSLDLIPSVVEHSLQEWKAPSKVPGTGGATYRVAAARQVGGFDENIRLIGEDMELAGRIRQAGWLILRGDAIFYEKHGKLGTWKGLWKRYVTQGIQNRRLYRKTDVFSSLYRMNPIASFIAGFRYAIFGYIITKRKTVFLLPFHFTFKMVAWFCGFNKG